jgi:hypothetical protein
MRQPFWLLPLQQFLHDHHLVEVVVVAKLPIWHPQLFCFKF